MVAQEQATCSQQTGCRREQHGLSILPATLKQASTQRRPSLVLSIDLLRRLFLLFPLLLVMVHKLLRRIFHGTERHTVPAALRRVALEDAIEPGSLAATSLTHATGLSPPLCS